MEVFQLRFVGAGLFFLWIIPSGLWLKHSGKPYGFVLFNLHKLLGLGVFIFLAANVYRWNQSVPLSVIQLIVCVITVLLFLATIVSGGLVSIDRPLPVSMLMMHRVLPYLTVLFTIASLYFLLINQ